MSIAPVPKLADVEHVLIVTALEQTGGNERQAASRLGISLKTLYTKLHLYNEHRFLKWSGEPCRDRVCRARAQRSGLWP